MITVWECEKHIKCLCLARFLNLMIFLSLFHPVECSLITCIVVSGGSLTTILSANQERLIMVPLCLFSRNRAIADYLRSNGYEEAYSTFKKEAELDNVSRLRTDTYIHTANQTNLNKQ